jgi:putative GTP pyrophosphokinase
VTNTRQRRLRPSAPTTAQLDELIAHFEKHRDEFDLFRRQVVDYFSVTKRFTAGTLPLVHSVKSRMKDLDHLKEKIIRKWADGAMTTRSAFGRVTDFAGVRVIHLHSRQFAEIHTAVGEHIQQGFWTLHEAPVAYSWDPEATEFFRGLGLAAQLRDSYYTSIHYVVKPQVQSDITCEIQVRTLFEEAWGEIDHALNYPKQIDSVACKEQIRVLAKLASTGTRLADSIFASAQHEAARRPTRRSVR